MMNLNDPIKCESRDEEILCHGLLRLLREGVELEKIDGRQIRMAAAQHRTEYIERLEAENARVEEHIAAMKKEMESLGI